MRLRISVITLLSVIYYVCLLTNACFPGFFDAESFTKEVNGLWKVIYIKSGLSRHHHICKETDEEKTRYACYTVHFNVTPPDYELGQVDIRYQIADEKFESHHFHGILSINTYHGYATMNLTDSTEHGKALPQRRISILHGHGHRMTFFVSTSFNKTVSDCEVWTAIKTKNEIPSKKTIKDNLPSIRYKIANKVDWNHCDE